MNGRRGGLKVNLAIYGRGLVHLVRHPSVLVVPLVASLIDATLHYTSNTVTDPLGGFGAGIFGMIVQVIYLFSFGAAIVQANNIERGRRGSFDESWDETRQKAGGILIAAIGFQFIVYVAQYIGQLLPVAPLVLALELLAYFFLILTIPAAAIGGLPGGLALSGSFRAVRSNVLACLVLAVAFVLLWVIVPELALPYLSNLSPIVYDLVSAIYRAIVLGYLAFPFAVTYDDIAFKLW